MSTQPISEHVNVCLTADLHGFPTFVVLYRRTRYNFCHLQDVCSFLCKVYNVDNDRLLHKQRCGVSAPRLVRAKTVPPRITRELILAVCHEPTRQKEVINCVLRDYPAFNKKQIKNQITILLIQKKLETVEYGVYLTKKCVDGTPRQIVSVTG